MHFKSKTGINWHHYIGFGVSLDALSEQAVITKDQIQVRRKELQEALLLYGKLLMGCMGILLLLVSNYLLDLPLSTPSATPMIQMGAEELILVEGIAKSAPQFWGLMSFSFFFTVFLSGLFLTLRWKAKREQEGLSILCEKRQRLLNRWLLQDALCANYVQKVLKVRTFVCDFEFEAMRMHRTDRILRIQEQRLKVKNG